MKSKIRPVLSALLSTGICVSTAYADRVFPAWVQVYDYSVNRSQFAKAVAVDNRGNVAVTGYIIDESNTQVLYVAKYDTLNGNPDNNPQGKLIWEKTFKSQTGQAQGQGVACDSAGNVIVTGWLDTANNQKDYITIKLSAVDGTPLWQRTYNNSAANGSDEGMRVAVDRLDNVVVTGKSAGNGTNDDIHTIKYLANGTFSWERRYNHSGNRNDFPSSIAVDPDDFVVVAGTADFSSSTTKFYTGKYRNTDGAVGVAGTWEKTFLSEAQGATDMAVDSVGNVIVTGPVYGSSNFSKDIQTIKYQSSTGNLLWSRSYATLEPTTNWAGVAVDSEGNVFMTSTSAVGINGRRMYTAKYSGANGLLAPLWEKYSPGLDFDDQALGIAVDPAGTVAVIARSNSTDDDLQNEFYIARYGGTDGETREEFSFNGNDSGGDDIPVGIAMDKSGGFAVVGNIKKPRASDNLFYTAIATIKFNRLLAVTGDPVTGTGVPDGAKLASISTPAISNDGGVAARVTIAAGKKTKLGAIFTQGATGTPEITALQGGEAPGTPNATYKSFLDPVLAQNGRLAFIATLAGETKKSSLAVFSNVTGTLTRHLQQGQQIPDYPMGTVLNSVSGISIRGSGFAAQVVALVTLAGPDIDKTNNVALVGINILGTVTELLRTGVDEVLGSKVKSITTLSSAKGATGHGRWQSDTRVLARVTLEDKRTMDLQISYAGGITPLLSTGLDATMFADGAKWNALGLPAIGSGSVSATFGSAAGANVPKGGDSGLVYTTDATTFKFIAREGADADGVQGAQFAAFGEPVVSLGNEVAFVGTLKGKGVKGSNKLGIWSGSLSPQLQGLDLLARQGDKATDSRGEAGTTPWTSFLSLAHPGGPNSGPIFLAKVAGKKNNLGLWAQDSCEKLRQVIRVGDFFGDQLLTNMTLLQGTAGVSGATRSFNNTGAVGVLLNFKDKTQAIYYLGIP